MYFFNALFRYSSEFVGERIGIITPYKSQLSLLRSRFSRAFGSSISSEMEFNTVDGFQGREVDILILSTVRCSDTYSKAPKMNSSSIGFVADIRRMNVALTRARLSLWILGNGRTLQKNSDWAALLKDARERNLVISVRRPYKSICENILGKNPDTKYSDDYRGTLSEEKKKSHHVMPIESNREGCRWKSKNKEMKHGREHNKPSTSEGLETTKSKVETTEKCKKKAEQQRISEDNHKRMKKSKSRSVDLPEQEKGGLVKISNPPGSSEDAHRSGKTVKKTSDVHQLERENSGLKNISDTVESKGVEKPALNKNQEDKAGLRSHVSCKVRSKDMDAGGKLSAEIEKPKDMISKRKQQREAVDALLSSSLLPSKKSETSARAKAHKRPHSPSSTGGVSKPTKQQRGTVVF